MLVELQTGLELGLKFVEPIEVELEYSYLSLKWRFRNRLVCSDKFEYISMQTHNLQVCSECILQIQDFQVFVEKGSLNLFKICDGDIVDSEEIVTIVWNSESILNKQKWIGPLPITNEYLFVFA